MKKSLKHGLILSFPSLILGILLSNQIKQGINNESLISLSSIEAVGNEIENSKHEIESLNKSIEHKKMDLEKLKNAIKGDSGDIEKHVSQEIENLKLIGGLKNIEGPGVRIVIADNEDKEIVGESIQDDIIHDSEIQVILNDLKRAGAEAISINGQRVLSKSEVKCGGPIIRINGKSSINPFVITAIGDPKSLYASINAPQSLGWTLREVFNKRVEVEVKDNVFIPKYMYNIEEGD